MVRVKQRIVVGPALIVAVIASLVAVVLPAVGAPAPGSQQVTCEQATGAVEEATTQLAAAQRMLAKVKRQRQARKATRSQARQQRRAAVATRKQARAASPQAGQAIRLRKKIIALKTKRKNAIETNNIARVIYRLTVRIKKLQRRHHPIVRSDNNARKASKATQTVLAANRRIQRSKTALKQIKTHARAANQALAAARDDHSAAARVQEATCETSPDPATPAQPELTAVAASSGKATLTWTVDSDAEVEGFRLGWRLAGTQEWQRVDLAGSARAHTISGLIDGATYQLRIRATGPTGGGDWVTATVTLPFLAPAAPTWADVAATPTSIEATWVIPNGPADSVELAWRSSDNAAAWTTVTLGAETTSHTISGLTSGNTYQLRVRAINGDVISDWTLTQIRVPYVAPAAPSITSATPGDGFAEIQWQIDPDTTWDGLEVSWRVDEADAPWATQQVDATDATVTIDNLAGSTTYQVRMRALNHDAASDWSETVTVTLAATTPAAPTIDQITGADSEVELTWSTGADDVDGFVVAWRLDHPHATWEETTLDADLTEHVVDGLTNSLTYQVRVRSRHGQTVSHWSPVEVVTLAANAPSGVAATGLPGGLEVSWDAPVELEVGPGTVIPTGGYLVLDQHTDFDFGLGGTDAARLFMPDGQTLIDEHWWSGHGKPSLVRCPGQPEEFVESTTVTKGGPNDCPDPVDARFDLVINEIVSKGGDPDDWVELHNPTDADIDASGLVFRDDDDAHHYAIPEDTIIEAGGFLVLDQHTDFDFGLGGTDAARLFMPDGQTLIDEHWWSGHGKPSLARCPGQPEEFVESTTVTKGGPNDCPDPVDARFDLVINEIVSKDGDPDDWVEIYNPTDADIDASGLVFRDDKDSNHYAIPGASIQPITGYEVTYRPSPGPDADPEAGWTSITTGIDPATVTLTDLDPQTVYEARVRALIGDIPSEWSPIVSDTTGAISAPDTPELTYIGLTDERDGFDIEWTPGHDGGAAATVQIAYRDEDESNWTTLEFDEDTTSTTITDLDTFTAYEFRARAINSAGNSAWISTQRHVLPQTSLPVLTITTDGREPIVSKDEYLTGSYSLDPNGHDVEAFDGTLRIRGRGNSTWNQIKKPYKVKLSDEASLVGMPSHTTWILLAEHIDNTLLRNSVALTLGNATSLAWTPDYRPIEVILNSEYIGLYTLTEHIDIEPSKIDIDQLTPFDISTPTITGGYYLERDARLNLGIDQGFRTSIGNEPIKIRRPKNITHEQQQYIQSYLDELESSLYGDDFTDPTEGYAKYIDISSLVDWYLVGELTKDQDFWLSSVKMYKPRNGKLTMGPLWDYDFSSGKNTDPEEASPTGWLARLKSPWVARLFQDPSFSSEVHTRWADLRDTFALAIHRVINTSQELDKAATNNNLRWSRNRDYAADAENLRSWYERRIHWLDSAFNDN